MPKNYLPSEFEMNNPISMCLIDLTKKYINAWQEKHQSLPPAGELAEIESPCLVTSENGDKLWQAVPHAQVKQLEGVEKGIEIAIHSDIHLFYGSQYSADLNLLWQGKPFVLLQAWSADDFERLQENILGHLVTQKRLKLKPTVFIGALDSDTDVISICNITGNVLLERLGTDKIDVLSEDLETFLSACEVDV